MRQGQARDWAGYRAASDTTQARTRARPELRGCSWANRTRACEKRLLVRLVGVIKTKQCVQDPDNQLGSEILIKVSTRLNIISSPTKG